MRNLAGQHLALDESIAAQKPEAIALGLIRELNAEQDCNYCFTERQRDILAERVAVYVSQGVIFTPELLYNIAYDADGLEDGFEDLAEILNDIFDCINENGQGFAEREQPYHFDSYPFPIK